MKLARAIIALSLLAGATFASGCAGFMRAPFVPPIGGTVNVTEFPIDTDYANTRLGERMGRSASHSILGLIAWGDSSVRAAAVEGSISRIDHIDATFLNVLGVYSRYETVVVGSGS